MAVLIVGLFEAVEIEDDYGNLKTANGCASEFFFQQAEDGACVEEAGKLILFGLLFSLPETQRVFDGEPSFGPDGEHDSQVILIESIRLQMIKSECSYGAILARKGDRQGRAQSGYFLWIV